MGGGDLKLAWQALLSNKLRSLMTMFGIIVGVIAVIVTVSLGEGIKQQVVGETKQFGDDLIVVRPGKIVRRDSKGNITGYNFFSGLGSTSLTEQDAELIRKSAGVGVSVPLSLIPGTLTRNGGPQYEHGNVIATTDKLPQVLNQKILYGDFFGPSEANRSVAVIGRTVAEELFGENVPIGKSFLFRNHEFLVSGIFEEFPATPLTTTVDFNSTVFIPYNVGKNLGGGGTQIYEILAKPANQGELDTVIRNLDGNLANAHGGQSDYTVLKQSENLNIASSIVDVITAFVAGIAAISLLVGGIGVMNIMFVSVTERTREIGIRKSIGATNRQIINQFMIESVVLSLSGGLLGILLSVIINFLIRIFTNLQPVITLPVMGVAAAVSVLVGIVFGLAPAIQAARKDPITALRYE
jgi:putative ABC transport system permease protein